MKNNYLTHKIKINLTISFLMIGILFSSPLFAQDTKSTKIQPTNNAIPVTSKKENNQSNNTQIKDPKQSKQVFATSCNKIYASGYSSGRNTIYELNGFTMTPVFTAPQNVGGFAVSANGNAYYDNGFFSSSPVFSSDLTTQTNTGATFVNLMAGQAADPAGNVYYVDTSRHLRKNVFGSPTIASDLGAIIFESSDTIGRTLAYGDMALDGNGRLYWYSSINGTGASYLYVIDLVTLKAMSLGQIGPNAATGLAFDTTGKLITTSDWGATVISVDLASSSLQGVVVGTANPTVFDLGSCAAPILNPLLTAVKSVANITSGVNPATLAQSGDVLEYTIVVTNSGNLMSNNSTFQDVIPSNTTYVPNSTTVNGINVADISGTMPFATPRLINSTGQLPGIINVGAPVTIKFRVLINQNFVGFIPNTASANYITNINGTTSTQTANSNTVIVEVKPKEVIVEEEETPVEIFNHFTPNGDGINDYFHIKGIEKYPNNHVEIYNRWGILIYEVDGYNNADKSFKGESEGRITIQKQQQLPEGTYYYIIKYTRRNGEEIQKSSYVFVNR
ncbi:MAG: gliding motility-associated C-terminal domain-containing protein [Limnohabitans sp.]|nr:gliding motility-associated C-terminal domain-containing protein [Limnohabitans sp.]